MQTGDTPYKVTVPTGTTSAPRQVLDAVDGYHSYFSQKY